MSGKVAKPKEDKDASKGKRRALPCTDCFTPKITGFFFVFFLKHPFIPYMVPESPFGGSSENKKQPLLMVEPFPARCMWTFAV